MNVRRWGGVLRLFHGYPQTSHKQRHGQRFGAIDVASLRAKRLNSLHFFTLTLSGGWDAPFLAQTTPLGFLGIDEQCFASC